MGMNNTTTNIDANNNNSNRQRQLQHQQQRTKPSNNSNNNNVVGKRTGVTFPPRGSTSIPFNDDGLENVDAFFASAQSPTTTTTTTTSPGSGGGNTAAAGGGVGAYGKRAEKLRQQQRKQEEERRLRQSQLEELEKEAALNALRRPDILNNINPNSNSSSNSAADNDKATYLLPTPRQPPGWSNRMLHAAMGILPMPTNTHEGESSPSSSFSVLSPVSTAPPSTTRGGGAAASTGNNGGGRGDSSIDVASRLAMRNQSNQDSLQLDRVVRMQQQQQHSPPVHDDDDEYEEDDYGGAAVGGGGEEEEEEDDDDFHYDGPVDPPEEMISKMMSGGSQGSNPSRGMDPEEEREEEEDDRDGGGMDPYFDGGGGGRGGDEYDDEEEEDNVVAKSSKAAASSSSAASSKLSNPLENSLEEVVDHYDDDDNDGGGGGGMQLATQQMDEEDEQSYGGGGNNDYFDDDGNNDMVSASQRSRGSSSRSRDDEEDSEPPMKKKSKDEKKQRQQQQQTPVTPTSVLRTSKSKKNKKKQTTNRVNWSTPNGTAKGIPAGPREYEAIPVTDYKSNYPPGEEPQTPGGSALRRSRRARFKPLQFWKNEKLIYEAQNEEGWLGEAMGDMPVVAGVMHALPTPYKEVKRRERETTKPDKKSKKKKDKRKRGEEDSGEDDDDNEDASSSSAALEPFDDKALRKKYRIRNGESGTVWSETLESTTDTKIVSRLDNRTFSKLPLSSARGKRESKVVGFASQSFHQPTDAEDMFPGYIAGNVVIPPRGIKDAEGVGLCSQVFTVGECQPNSLELAVADPTGQDGEFDPDTAQRYLLSKGDMFQIPPGNVYRIENHSKKTKAALFWVIIKCMSKAEQDDESEEG